MPRIRLIDVAKIFPFVSTGGLFYRKQKRKILERQKAMPYTSNEGVIALQHISIQIEDGEFVVVVGESGSGKSTLLRVIAGLEAASVGDIYFDDQLMNNVLPQERDVAMVFQNYALYPGQTVYENIAFPLQTQHMPREQLDEKVRNMAELLDITDKLESFPEDLSGGERQRVAIGRALVREPRIFLLDEPFANLDPVMRASLRSELKRIHQKLKTNFIYVTHDQTEALSLAERIIVLKDGILQQNDEASAVYNYPANRYVATMIGTPQINFIEDVDVSYKGNRGFINLFGREYELTSSGRNKNRLTKVTVGIRPVNIEADSGECIGTVDYTEMLGSDLVIHFTADGKQLTAVKKIAGEYTDTHFKGDTVRFRIPGEYLHFFDEKGNRLPLETM